MKIKINSRDKIHDTTYSFFVTLYNFHVKYAKHVWKIHICIKIRSLIITHETNIFFTSYNNSSVMKNDRNIFFFFFGHTLYKIEF